MVPSTLGGRNDLKDGRKDWRKDGRTEGLNAENYVIPLIFDPLVRQYQTDLSAYAKTLIDADQNSVR